MRRAAELALFAAAALATAGARALGYTDSPWLEVFGAATGAACVLLVVRKSVWNFPVGIASCAAYLALFAQDKLFAEAGLQVAFVALNLHGWYSWARPAPAGGPKPVARVPLGELTLLAALFPAVWLGLAEVLRYFNDSSPVFDAFVSSLSLMAQWLLNRRYVENWLAWAVVDQVSVVLFYSRGMHLTAALYALFLAMCVAGYLEWRRDLAQPFGERTP